MRLAVVVPRYGADILGGAETFARNFAEQMSARGSRVDVLTTCIRSYFTWENELPPGPLTVNGINVRRFPIAPGWDMAGYQNSIKLIFQGRIRLDQQYEWLEKSPHSPDLYAYIARHQTDYDFFIFIPYLYSIIQYGALVVPHKSIIWPCLHDEFFAWMQPTRVVLASVRGLMFNAEPERQLAHRLGVRHAGEAVVGFGLEDETGSAERFRQTTGLTGPILLYSGRLEGAKNVPLLVRFFMDYKAERGGPWQLVLMGAGPEAIPGHPDIHALGFRQGQAKLDAYAAASVLCQPSVNESFSIVIMESWLARVPVLVHAHCAVTRCHAQRASGGLYFSSYVDFAEALDWFAENDALRRRMGDNGRRYVTTNYNWDAVARRFYAAAERWQANPSLEESRPL
jgi:glycosyltransferase involved in cell wall biosynthesis